MAMKKMKLNYKTQIKCGQSTNKNLVTAMNWDLSDHRCNTKI